MRYNFRMACRTSGAVIIAVIILFLPGCERPVDSGGLDDGIPPSAPTGLAVYYASDGEIEIIWQRNPQKDVTYYVIERSTDDSASFTPIDSTNDLFYVDAYLHYDSLYFYRLVAVDRTSLRSPVSKYVSAKPINRFKPRVPSGFIVQGRNWERAYIYLAWKPNYEPDLSHYLLYRGSSPVFFPDSTNLLGSPVHFEYYDSLGVNVNRDYYYKLFAVDKGGLISASAASSSDVILPEPILIYPQDNSTVTPPFTFKFLSVSRPCDYRLIVQSSPSYGEIWSATFSSSGINDTVVIQPSLYYFEYGRRYYWQVFTYTNSAIVPNSVSAVNSFILRRY